MGDFSQFRLERLIQTAIPINPDMILDWRRFAEADAPTLRLRGLTLTPDQQLVPIQIDHDTTELFLPRSKRIRLHDGWLLSLNIFMMGPAKQRGLDYNVVSLLYRSEEPENAVITLIKGYYEGENHLSWPYGRHVEMTEGQGAIVTTVVPNPAAGAGFTYTVPSNTRERVLAVRYELNTDATAGNRTAGIELKTATDMPIAETRTSFLQGPSSGFIYNFWHGITEIPDTTGSNVIGSLPPITLTGGMKITSDIGNFKPGDQISNIAITTERWVAIP